MSNFIDDYLQYNKFFESPTSFWKWSAYAIIAAILKDSVWKQEKDGKLCPNIYVLLLADSAVQRKDRPVITCERLVNRVGNTKVISGRSSIQALLDELAGAETDPKTGRISAGGQGLFIAPELSAGIVQDPQSVDILTDIYSSRELFTSRLRGSGKFKIKNLCLSMMAASNSAMISGAYDTRALAGGLLGRTMLIFPNEFRPGNSLWTVEDTGITEDQLYKMLIPIAQLRGPMIFSLEAQKCFDNWYLPFRESYRFKQDGSGIAGRIHTSTIKLSMIITAAKSCGSMVVCAEHMEEAIEECLSLIPNYQQLTMTTSKVPIAQIHALIMNELVGAPSGSVNRKVLLQRHIMSMDVESLDKSISTLEQAGLINQITIENNIVYILSDKGKELFTKKNDNQNSKT